jgi:hypothetical protein
MSAAACAPVPVGEGVSPRIRIGATDPALRGPTGTVIVWDSGGVTVVHRLRDAAPDTVRVPARPMTRLDVSAGGTSSVARGALIGALVVGAAGLAMALTEDGCGDSCYSPSPAVGVVSMAAVGAGIGALVGLVVRADR